jgi:hypothetical protein
VYGALSHKPKRLPCIPRAAWPVESSLQKPRILYFSAENGNQLPILDDHVLKQTLDFRKIVS